MANIFTLENFADFSEKLNIDELYEKKRQNDLNKLELYKKILNRINIRIKTTAKQTTKDKFCWFVVPEIIIGVPKYDQGACIAYLMNTLKENGFNVRYFHPNTLFISWDHWIPSYVRNEIKKKTGLVINEYGEKVEQDSEIVEEEENKEVFQQINNSKKYTPINSYKPSGKLVYSEDLLNRIDDKLTK
jgi:hypothetical protein